MTDSETLLALTAVRNEVREYLTELAGFPADTLPADYDAVCLAEWTDILSTRAESSHNASAFLGSFWDSHHMLAAHIPYERAIRVWFSWAEDTLTNSIENHS